MTTTYRILDSMNAELATVELPSSVPSGLGAPSFSVFVVDATVSALSLPVGTTLEAFEIVAPSGPSNWRVSYGATVVNVVPA